MSANMEIYGYDITSSILRIIHHESYCLISHRLLRSWLMMIFAVDQAVTKVAIVATACDNIFVLGNL